tara:strand:+ start:646 stop:3072 length:2427 start_codon:yes stop_codon:yes gene_type:complete
LGAKRQVVESTAGLRHTWAMICGVFGVLLLLSLLSYDWRDIGALRSPPNDPPHNWVGPAGAWLSYVLLMGFGLVSYLIPLLFLNMSAILWLKPEERIWPKALWSLVFVVAVGALLDVSAGRWAGFCESRNLGAFAGGVISYGINTGILVRLVGTFGATIVGLTLFVVSIPFLVRMQTLVGSLNAIAAAVMLGVEWVSGRVRERCARPNGVTQEERDVEKRRKRLENTLKKEDARRPKKDPTRAVVPDPVLERPDEPAPTEPETVPEEIVRPEAPQEKPAPKRKLPFSSKPKKEAAAPQAPARPISLMDYNLPSLSLLTVATEKRKPLKSDGATTASVLEETLKEFGVDAEVVDVQVGPVVTRYEVLPARGVRVEKISGLSNNIALALKATSVRVQAPVPGKGVVGIEIPNATSQVVLIREILEAEEWTGSEAALPLVLGKDVGGMDLVVDLASAPHLLIAGATGSGKTVCMNSILAGLLMSRTPAQMNLMLIDPKIVEFSRFNGLPHLVTPVVTDAKKVAIALRWAIQEMENRYKLFASVGVRDIGSYNRRTVGKQQDLFDEESASDEEADAAPATVPYIVIVIDELADLMLAAQAEIENCIARLAQLSRAIGIHMIIATQRPSVNVITGTIKANFPARLAFQVAQRVDSRTILDTIGAEKLLGRGDLLYHPPGSSKLLRAQGALTSDEEMVRIIEHARAQGAPHFVAEIHEKMESKSSVSGAGGDEPDDELLEQAVTIIRETQRASTSSLQRRLRIGYTRAARLMDVLEERGIIGPPRGSDPREILIDLDLGVPGEADAAEEAEEMV